MKVTEKRPEESLKEFAYRVLKENIVNMELEPGRLLSENEIGQQLGVSRAPIREAFSQLASQKLVEIQPQRGTFVTLIDYEYVEEVRFLRSVVEKEIAGMACGCLTEEYEDQLEENLVLQDFCLRKKNFQRFLKLDKSFHKLLFDCCGKQVIYDLIEQVIPAFDRQRKLSFEELNPRQIYMDHCEILQAIQAKDKEKAVSLAAEHLTHVTKDQKILKEKYPQYFK